MSLTGRDLDRREPGQSWPHTSRLVVVYGSVSFAVVALLAVLLVSQMTLSAPTPSRAPSAAQPVLILLVGLLVLWAVLLWAMTILGRRAAAHVQAVTDLADHDSVTGLPNRTAFARLVAEALEGRADIAVALVDLRRFQDVNDTLGHRTGDRLLRLVADRLRARAGDGEHLARTGGDEFGLLLPGVTTPQAARARATDLLGAFDRSFDMDEIAIDTDATVGMALTQTALTQTAQTALTRTALAETAGATPRDPADAEVLIQQADIALYQAKVAHQPVVIYDPSRNHFTRDRLELASEIRTALDEDQLEVVYQPQRNLRTGRVHSVEALIRWHHPSRGLLMPADFLHVAEQSDLIRDLSAYVLDSALAQLRCWHDVGLRLRVSVNLSARDCTNAALPVVVRDALERHGLSTEDLTLELTESAMLTNLIAAEAVLGDLAAMGVEVAVDDFGSGYASLAYVRRMPVSELKIDRTCIMNLHGGGPDADIVRFTIELGRRLCLRVVAEGAEHAEDLTVLTDMGCQVVQGYTIARPMSAGPMTTWLAENRTVSLNQDPMPLSRWSAEPRSAQPLVR